MPSEIFWLKNSEVCSDVQIEPQLLPLKGEVFSARTVLTGERLNTLGLTLGQEASTDVDSNNSLTLNAEPKL